MRSCCSVQEQREFVVKHAKCYVYQAQLGSDRFILQVLRANIELANIGSMKYLENSVMKTCSKRETYIETMLSN